MNRQNKTQSGKALLILGIILFALILLALLLSSLFRHGNPLSQQVPDAGQSLRQKKSSYTTFETGEDEEKLNSKKRQELNSYGKTSSGKVHIPIEKAMDYYLKRENAK